VLYLQRAKAGDLNPKEDPYPYAREIEDHASFVRYALCVRACPFNMWFLEGF
jgi:hypothetical protein